MPMKRSTSPARDVERDCKRSRSDDVVVCLPQSCGQRHDLPCNIEDEQCGRIKVRSNLHRWQAFSNKLRSLEHVLVSPAPAKWFASSLTGIAEDAHACCPGCMMPVENSHDAVARRSIFVQSCQRSFTTLSEAVRNASEFETILLDDGIYVEQDSIVLEKEGVTIRAKHSDPTETRNVHIVSHTVEKHCFVVRAKGCVVFGLDVLHMSCHEEAHTHAKNQEQAASTTRHSVAESPMSKTSPRGCFSIEASNGCVDSCTITSVSGYGVMVWADAQPTVRGCVIQHCAQAAIICGGTSSGSFQDNTLLFNKSFGFVVVDEAQGTFQNNSVLKTAKCGVLCAGQSRAIFRANEIADGSQGGMWIRNSSEVQIIKNMIRNNAKAGLQVGDESNPRVENNTVENGKNGGVVIHGKARGLFIGNFLSGHAQAGVGVMDLASPVLIGNTLEANTAGGAILAGKSNSVWHNNTVKGNAVVGIGLKEDAVAQIGGGAIEDNDGHGLLLQSNCRLRLQDAVVSGNARAEIICAGTSGLSASGCWLHAAAGARAGTVGLQCTEEASAECERSSIRGHASGNVVLQDAAEASLKGCSVAESAWAGVLLQGSSRVVLRGNRITANGTGLLAMESACWAAERNTISDSRSYGVLAAGASRGVLARNNCSGNGHRGLLLKGGAEAAVLHNRFSWNGGEGVALEEGCKARLEGNCAFENAGHAVFVCGRAELHASANVLASSKTALAVRVEGECSGALAGNVVDGFDQDEASGAQLSFTDNELASQAELKRRVLEALELGLVGPGAPCGHVAVMVGGTVCLGASVADL
mmetsp:Transcript_19842/g.47311  ORF Transcript_19842/g.47311 Transcript_19842/m.47311 type:complete len:812 (-) Transcript_19842:343-2778(-)